MEGLPERVQIDHTPADVIVVDEFHRLPIGRPYVTAAIDEATRCVPGLVVTLEAPSAASVGNRRGGAVSKSMARSPGGDGDLGVGIGPVRSATV
ncbi:hypothetical protein [Nocardia sp. NPDC046763]|uniref:hypothetical protein n=1 Tax=Nocardia sp. NPDC046763 TaxID=3155256 RepID=UPI0033C2F1E3